MIDHGVQLRVALWCGALVGCGASSTGPSASPPPGPQVASISRAESERAERERRQNLAAAHRELEDEQQSFLAATCDKSATKNPPARCEPSCYRIEPADPRAGKKLGRAEIVHLVCRPADADETASILFADEIGGGRVAVRAGRGRVPKPHKKGTWEAELETAVGVALRPEMGRGDTIRVVGGWKPLVHPMTNEQLRCVLVVHHVMSMRRPLDACGSGGAIACEATGNSAAHGINVVHYRLAEARQLHAANKQTECQRAALESIAVARGMPRWRQYVSLNVNQWKAYPRYRTRFDGVLDEEALFATAIRLGREAEAVHAGCGGGSPTTTAAQEQSFHTCW